MGIDYTITILWNIYSEKEELNYEYKFNFKMIICIQ